MLLKGKVTSLPFSRSVLGTIPQSPECGLQTTFPDLRYSVSKGEHTGTCVHLPSTAATSTATSLLASPKTQMKGACGVWQPAVLTSKATFRERRTHSRSSCTLRRSSPPLRLREAGHTRRVQSDWQVRNSSSIHSLNTSLLWAMKIRGKLHLGDIFRGKKADSQLTEGMQQSAHTAPQSMLARGGFPPLPCDITAPCVIRLTGTRKREKMENPGPRPLQRPRGSA